MSLTSYRAAPPRVTIGGITLDVTIATSLAVAIRTANRTCCCKLRPDLAFSNDKAAHRHGRLR